MNSGRRRPLVVVMHRIDRQGGQERSTLELLTRLARQGAEISYYGFRLLDWPSDLKIRFIAVPGSRIKIQWFKNLWFSLWTAVVVKKTSDALLVTTGVSSWRADIRIVQYCHTAFLQLMREGHVQEPNPRTWLHRLYQRFFTRWNAMLERWFLPRTEQIIAISHQVKNDLVTLLNVDPKRITVVHHAPDQSPERFLVPRGTRPLACLFVGALERKGIDTVLNALALVGDKNWKLTVLGVGHVEHWRKKSEALRIGEQVEFKGMQPSQQYFAQADVFVFPSRYEPFGLVVSEAVTHLNLPLVSKECGAMELWPVIPPELCLSAFDGPERWAEVLSWVLAHDEQRVELARQAHAAFSAWTWDQAADAYRAVLATCR